MFPDVEEFKSKQARFFPSFLSIFKHDGELKVRFVSLLCNPVAELIYQTSNIDKPSFIDVIIFIFQANQTARSPFINK